jgi:hypothetical protein
LIVKFEGEPRELRELLRETFNPALTYDRTTGAPASRDAATLEDFATDLAEPGEYSERAGLIVEVERLTAQRATLEGQLEVLQARLASAMPVVEAQAVIDKAVELWRVLEKAARSLTLALNEDAAGDIAAKREAELLRAIRVLGDHLGEEGGEEESPATATLRDA